MLETGVMSLAEVAAYLVNSGVYSTIAEAMAALNIVIVDEVGATGTAIAVSGGAAQLVTGAAGQTALEVATEAELAATAQTVKTSAIGLLQGETGVSVGAILGADLGIVAAAAAPILGVSLGAELYQSNPELWTKISQKLLPFCYPGTTKIPTWADIAETAWSTSVAKKVIDALKEVFDEEGVGGESSAVSTPEQYASTGYSYNVPLSSTLVWEGQYGQVVRAEYSSADGSSIGCWCTISGTAFIPYFVSRNLPIVIDWSTTNSSGVTTHYTRSGGSSYTLPDGSIAYSLDAPSISGGQINPGYITSSSGRWVSSMSARIIDVIFNGNQISGGYPAGTSQWQGTTPTEIPESKPAVIGIDSTQPMVPVSFPQEIPDTWQPGESVASPNPEVQPDPTVTTDPETQVQPYIQPLPIPGQVTDVTVQPEAEVDPNLDPTIPRPPTQVVVDPPVNLGPDPIGISPWPIMPTTSLPFDLSNNVGLVTVYHPTPAQLYAFERWLWVTYADATIDKIWNNPFDGIITLFELYCTPTDVGNQTIRSGFLDSGINSAVISRYTYIDCGTLGIPEYYGNYLDYSPYSKAHIYLPFIGVQELNVDDIVGHAVNVTYRIDEYNGSCIAMITVAKVTEVNGEPVEYSNTMYQFSGNCAVELPITGGSQASIKAGMMTADAYQQASQISAGASLIGGIGSLLMGSVGGAIHGVGSAASQYAYGQANALSNMLSGKSTVQKSGSFGSSHGALGIKTPFITITRPKQIQVANYNDLYGFPAHKMVTIGNCTGFLRCREVNVVSPTATDDEKSMIEQLLKTGVYVTE